MATITANLNGGDETTPDNELIFKIYGDADNYTTAIATTGNAINDANISVSAGVVTILNVDVTGQGNIKLTSIDAEGNESSQSGAFATVQTYFVRPTGQTYGTGDGLSYANAWSGDAGIDYTLASGNIVEVCDTHTQTFAITQNDVTFKFDGANPGNINATGMNNGINVIGVDNFKAIEPDVQNATAQNFYFENSFNNEIIGGDSSGSGNQGTQNWNNCSVKFVNHTSNNNDDEGISGHGNSDIHVVGGQYKNNTNNFLNTIDTTQSLVEDFWDGGNEKEDIFMAGSGGTECVVKNSYIRGIKLDANTKLTIDNSYIEADNQFIDGHLKLDRCVVDFTNATLSNIGFDFRSQSTIEINHCIFINVPANIAFAIAVRDGCTINGINNNTFYSTLQQSTAIFSNHPNIVTNNNIYVGFDQAIFANLGFFTDNNGVFHNNNTNAAGNATSLVDALIADPLFTNPATLDFSLQPTSPAIGYGLTVLNTLGIESAVWGDGTAFSPTVVEKEQTAPFDCGAFVY